MSKKIIVSIISEHNVPNISLIRNINADIYLDILTQISKKEYYSNYINAATNEKKSYITDRFDNIIVDESDPENITNTLLMKNTIFDEAETIFVNVTGGTKLLSLYTYIFFKEKYANKSKFYYMNITSSSNEFIDLDTKKIIEMNTVLSLKQYLHSYGYNIQHDAKESFSYETANIILKEYTGSKYKSVRTILNEFLNLLKDKYLSNKEKRNKLYNSFVIKDIISELQIKYAEKQKNKSTIASIVNNKDNICQFIDSIAARVNHTKFRNSNNMNIKTLKYIISGFLEEYIYNLIKKEIFINSKQEYMIEENIKQSVRLKKVLNSNEDDAKYIPELDVLFCYNNKLCYIECKSSAYFDLINDTAIKQKAISSTLSISAYNAFIILNDFTTDKEHNQLEAVKEKAKNFKINIITKDELLDGTFISNLKKYCNIPLN